MPSTPKLLTGLLLFNGLTALAGGVGLLGGAMAPPEAWLGHTPFSSYVMPGLILGIVVGGSSLFAAAGLFRAHRLAYQQCIVAGMIMIGWIIGEIAFIRQFSWLQVVYLLSGLVTIMVARRSSRVTQNGADV